MNNWRFYVRCALGYMQLCACVFVEKLRGVPRSDTVQCRRCGAYIRERDAELCWWCGDYLCVDCWERFGHCGHAGADEHVRLGKLGLLYDCPISWAGYPEATREQLAQEAHARARAREAGA